jgi:hypothetical protein
MLVLVPKGRRIVAQGGASDSGHTRNPGETEEVMSAPGRAAETQYDQNIRAGLPSPFLGLSAGGFLPPRVPLRFTLGYDSGALPGLKTALCGSSGVSREKLTSR